MTSEQIWQRTELLGTQVITRDTGKRLGLVNELLVDVNRREVVAQACGIMQFPECCQG